MRQCTRFIHINVIERDNSTFIVNYNIMYLLFLLDLLDKVLDLCVLMLMTEVIIINFMFRNISLYPANTGQVITNCKDKNCENPKAYKWVECYYCGEWFRQVCIGLKLKMKNTVNLFCDKCQ